MYLIYFNIFNFYLVLSLLFHLDIIRLLIIWIYSILRGMSLLLGVMHVTYSFWLYYRFLLLLPIFLLFLALYVLCNSPCLEESQGKCRPPNLYHLPPQPPQCSLRWTSPRVLGQYYFTLWWNSLKIDEAFYNPRECHLFGQFCELISFRWEGEKKRNHHLCLNLKNSDLKSLLKSPLVT